MSRIGRAPITVPSGVTVTLAGRSVTVQGPKGELQQVVPARIGIVQEDNVVTITRPTERGTDRALHGLTRTLVANMVETGKTPLLTPAELADLGFLDLTLFAIACIVGPRWIAVAAAAGPGSVTLWIAAALALNISKGGVAIRTMSPLATGTPVTLRFRLPSGTADLEVSGRVIWSNRQVGMGVQFETLSRDAQAAIEGFVDRNS